MCRLTGRAEGQQDGFSSSDPVRGLYFHERKDTGRVWTDLIVKVLPLADRQVVQVAHCAA